MREAQARADRRSRAGRRLDARADGAAAGEGTVQGQRAEQDASTPTKWSRSAPPFRARIATGDVKDILVLDATPLSLGVETLGRRDDRADPAQHDDPDEQEGSLLDRRGQPERGDDQRAAGRARVRPADNRLLGTFNLEGIPPAPRGVPQIEVTFNIDVNGILTVSAKDKGTGKENKITVQNAGGLSQGRDRKDEARGRGPRRRGQETPRGDRPEEPGRKPGLPDRKDRSRSTAKRSPPTCAATSRAR